MDVTTPFTSTDLTATGLLLLAALWGLNMYLTHRKNGNGKPCPYHHEIKEVHRKLDAMAYAHSQEGEHHKSLERCERRIGALMRASNVPDPDGKF